MKRIQTTNGYAIYEAKSLRDEETYNCHVGHYNLYLSSDIREFGLSNSYADYEDIETLSEAIALASGSQFAVATAMAWELSDSTVEDTALRDEIERRLEAGQPMDYIRDHYDTENGCFVLDWMDTQPEEDEPEYTHVEPISRDRKADLFDRLLSHVLEVEYEDGDILSTLRDCGFSDDEVRASLPGWLAVDMDLAPVGLDRGGATPRDVEYSDGSFGVETPRWRVYYEGDIFPEDHYVRGSVGITREYWDGDKARSLRDYCEKHHVPVWLDDTYYGVTEHDGDCY